MSQRPRISAEMRRWIAQEALADREKSRAMLALELQDKMERVGQRVIPAVETLEKLISRARNYPTSPFDEPWSLGVSPQPEYGITPESTGDLLAVWNYCLAIGHVFTIREARWVARLRNAIADHKRATGKLFAFAYGYALRERTCEILNKQIDTIDLDSELGLNDSELFVYHVLGLVPKLAVPFHPREAEEANEFLTHWAFGKSAATNIAVQNIPKAARNDTDGLHKLLHCTENLPAEQDRIYAALLLFLSKGPRWKTLSVQEYLLLLSELRKWVVEGLSPKQLYNYALLDSEGGIEPTDILDPALLEVVGYEVTIKTTNKEAHDERSHSQEIQE